MSLVFQNIDLPSPSPPGECVLPPNKGGGYTYTIHTRRAERGMDKKSLCAWNTSTMLPAGRKSGCITHKGQNKSATDWKTQKGTKKGTNLVPLNFIYEGPEAPLDDILQYSTLKLYHR